MTPLTDPWFYATALPAVVLMGMGKGGFGGTLALLAMPLMAIGAPVMQAAAIMLPILLVMDAISVWAWRKTWSRDNLLILVPGGILGTVLGYLTASVVPDSAVKLMMGVISLLFCLQTWLARGADRHPEPPNWAKGSFWSAIAGFTSFISHVGGPPLSIYMLPQKLPKEVFAGTFVMYFAIINLVKVTPFFALGTFTAQNLSTSLILLPLAALSTLFGVWLVKRVSNTAFFRFIYGTLFLVALKLTWDGIRDLFF
jgi:uncharacterized protein